MLVVVLLKQLLLRQTVFAMLLNKGNVLFFIYNLRLLKQSIAVMGQRALRGRPLARAPQASGQGGLDAHDEH